ncbi:MAG: helix-hairpin-helix domain-containing protein [Armatimonadota bacterium]
MTEESAYQRIYRRMSGVRGIPPDHTVVLCAVERDGRMATGSGADFESARACVDRKLDGIEGDADCAPVEPITRWWPEEAVRVNGLSARELARAAGITEELAEAVVHHREANGPFCCGPDIGRVVHADREGLLRLAASADYTVGPAGESRFPVSVADEDLEGAADPRA